MTDETVANPRWSIPHGLLTPLKIVGGILAVLFAIWLVLFITKGRFLKEPFVNIASRTIDRQVSIGGDFQLYFNPFHIKFLAEDFRVSNPEWARVDDFARGRRVELELNIWRLIFGTRRFNFVNLEGAAFGLERDAKGRNTWTFGRDKPAKPFELPEISRAAITGTRVGYIDQPLLLETDIGIGDIAARGTRVQGRIPFNGTGRSRGVPFRLTGALTSPNATLAGGENQLQLHIDVGDSRVDIAGTLPGATEIEGANLGLAARGGNLNTPFSLLGIVVPDTRRFNLRSNLTKDGDVWRFTRLRGTFGESDIAGRMTISQPNQRLLITADLTSRNLDILDAGPWIGYSPKRLDAQGGKGAITQEGGRPRILPDAPLASESLSRFDAKVAYRAHHVNTGAIPISNLEIDLGLDKKLLSLTPVAFDLAGGRLTSDIVINARKTPVVTDYDVRLSPVPLGRILTSFDVENSGTTATMRGRLKLRGYGDSVRKSLGSSSGRIAIIFPKGTLWIRNAELVELDLADFIQAAISKKLKKPADIRCGLLGFTVRQGTAVADPIFIDTEKSVIRGKGSFSFANESLHLSIEADSKNFSLFSGQSPIGIEGYFAAPRIDPIKGELIERGAIGVALGALVSPIAAVLAFIDVGEEKDTNCAPVLAGAHTAAVKAADKAAEKH